MGKDIDICEIFLGSFFSSLLDKLTSGDFRRLSGESNDDLLKKWSGKLTMIQAVLSDAETKQNALNAVKVWLNELQGVAYDLDDIVEDLTTAVLQRKLKLYRAGSINLLDRFSKSLNFKYDAFKFDRRMGRRINEITERLEDLIKHRSDLPLVEETRKRPFPAGERLPTTSLVNESFVYGREQEKEIVIRMIFDEPNDVIVIPIVGMGGVGKTTLAQLVYNDDKVIGSFVRAWACVTDDFDICRITRVILEQVTCQRCDFSDLNIFQVRLKEELSKRKFFLVLDDVWMDDSDNWEALRVPFFPGFPGSKILVTTRNEGVASITSFGPFFPLKELASDACLSLLAQQALGVENFNRFSYLNEIGKKIVKKCNNLPMAVKVLGGVLRSKLDVDEWEGVLCSDIWEVGENKILSALRLSYHHLPRHLKRCFVYCSIFPKDYEFNKSELILLWMAEGFLTQSKNLESLGDRYFKELMSRSFFQKSSTNGSRFVMPALINDLACYVAGRICTSLGYDSNDDQQYKVSKYVRHLSFAQSRYEVSQNFETLHHVPGLRTFLPLPVYPSKEYFISYRVLTDLFPKIKVVRVLSLSGYASIIKLPKSIGRLKQLRLLDLSRTSLKCLPQSVSSLCNLQTLSLQDCTYFTMLPSSIHNLINLRHLDISGTSALTKMPSGICSLGNLRTLSRFIVSEGSGLLLKNLGKLLNLEGALSIEELQNVMNAQEAKEANIKDKVGLRQLCLEWSSRFDGTRNPHHELCVLDHLQPPEKLECLKILSYGGLKFSSWIEDTYFPKLERIHLSKCTNCTSLPKLGHLPSLRELYIEGMNQVEALSSEFYGNTSTEPSFPLLETLEFLDMPEWHSWSCANVGVKFPRLRKLSVLSCPKLQSVPSSPSLVQLVLKECRVCVLKSLRCLSSLTHLSLENISAMTSLCESFVEFPLSLQVLKVECCNDLVTLLPTCDTVQKLLCLKDIVVKDCPRLVSLQEICSLPMLKSLQLESLESLQHLPLHLPSSLEMLEVKSCEQLKTTPGMVRGDCGASLVHLYLRDSTNPYTTNLLQSVFCFASLNELFLTGCDSMYALPGGLSTLSLKKLSIWNCRKLSSLPLQMETLTRLEYISLRNCTSLENFPQGKFPSNLTYLEIRYCETLKPLSEWNLTELNCLQQFAIVSGYPNLVSFSSADEETFLLPSTLTTFSVAELPKLKSLYHGFRNLLSLQHLNIRKCPELEVLPMEDQLAKLRSLHIHESPLLKKRCLENRYLCMIAEIPEVQDDQLLESLTV